MSKFEISKCLNRLQKYIRKYEFVAETKKWVENKIKEENLELCSNVLMEMLRIDEKTVERGGRLRRVKGRWIEGGSIKEKEIRDEGQIYKIAL